MANGRHPSIDVNSWPFVGRGQPDPRGIEQDGAIRDNISHYLKSGSSKVSFNYVWFIRILFDPATGKAQRYMIAGD
jgi:hypothetical protein